LRALARFYCDFHLDETNSAHEDARVPTPTFVSVRLMSCSKLISLERLGHPEYTLLHDVGSGEEPLDLPPGQQINAAYFGFSFSAHRLFTDKGEVETLKEACSHTDREKLKKRKDEMGFQRGKIVGCLYIVVLTNAPDFVGHLFNPYLFTHMLNDGIRKHNIKFPVTVLRHVASIPHDAFNVFMPGDLRYGV
jgi:hypothetical protein